MITLPKRPLLQLRTFVALIFVSLLSACQLAPLQPRLARGGGKPCGKQRWDVKTASDALINKVDANTPVPVTIHALIARTQPNPWKVNLPRQTNFNAATKKAVEKTLWKLNEVKLVKFVLEDDND